MVIKRNTRVVLVKQNDWRSEMHYMSLQCLIQWKKKRIMDQYIKLYWIQKIYKTLLKNKGKNERSIIYRGVAFSVMEDN